MRRGASSTIAIGSDLGRARVAFRLLLHLLQLENLDEAVVATGGHLGSVDVLVELDGHRDAVEFGAAVGAGPDVSPHLHDDFLFQLIVDKRRERLEHFLARHHDRAPIVRLLRVSLKWRDKWFRTLRRARCRRDFTAATERSRISATSAFECPSRSRSTKTCRNSAGSDSIASAIARCVSNVKSCSTGPGAQSAMLIGASRSSASSMETVGNCFFRSFISAELAVMR